MGGPVPDERGGEGTILLGKGEPPCLEERKKIEKTKENFFILFISLNVI